MKVEITDLKNKKAGTIDLPEEIFGIKWNSALVHQVVTAQKSSARKPVAHTKDRSEVRGGGKKPWRQKHTGRARHGSSRSPIWAGGGVTFGPRNERIFARKINKKMRIAALFSVLSKKLADREIKIVNNLQLEKPKTKELAGIFKNFFDKTLPSILVVTTKNNRDAALAGRNIPGVKMSSGENINIYDCLTHKYLFFDKEGVSNLIDHYSKTK